MRLHTLAACAAATLLVACGGGGDPEEAWANEFPVIETLYKTVARPYSASLSGSGYRLDLHRSPGPQEGPIVDGFRAASGIHGIATALEQVVVSRGNAILLFSNRTLVYVPSTSELLGSATAADRCSFVTKWQAPPGMAAPGATGDLYEVVSYVGFCSRDGGSTGKSVATWSLERESPDSAWVCVTIRSPGTFTSETQCALTTSAGSILRTRVILSINGGRITFN